jgi:hypothetical protein
MSLLEIEETERLSAQLSMEAFRDLTEWWWGGKNEPEMSPPLALGWDMTFAANGRTQRVSPFGGI